MPYSGPGFAYGTVGRLEAAYFEMINAAGGVNGRKINLISLDDSSVRPRPWSNARAGGTGRGARDRRTAWDADQLAVQKYLNLKGPPILITSGASKWMTRRPFPI